MQTQFTYSQSTWLTYKLSPNSHMFCSLPHTLSRQLLKGAGGAVDWTVGRSRMGRAGRPDLLLSGLPAGGGRGVEGMGSDTVNVPQSELPIVWVCHFLELTTRLFIEAAL